MSEFHTTKKGPGRKHADGTKRGGKRSTRFVQGLMNHWAKKRRDAMPKVGGHPRDTHGAVTFVGLAYECTGAEPTSREFVLSGGKDANGERFYTARRIWLAGISAQRGY